MTTILERLTGITQQRDDEALHLRATAQEVLEQLVFGTEPANLEDVLDECGITAAQMADAVRLVHQRQADARTMDDAGIAQGEQSALAIEEANDIRWFEERRAEFDARQAERTARMQQIESRLFAATEARRRLATTYQDNEIDSTLERCHDRMREIVDHIRRTEEMIQSRNAKLVQSQRSEASDRAEAVRICEEKLAEYRETISQLTAEKQRVQREIDAAELAKLDPMAVKL